MFALKLLISLLNTLKNHALYNGANESFKNFFPTIVVLFLIISSAPQNVYDVYATMLGTFSHVFFLFSMTLCNITPLHYNS